MSLTITGIVSMLLSQVLPIEEVDPFLNAAVVVITTLVAWYGRYRVGDITWWGGKK